QADDGEHGHREQYGQGERDAEAGGEHRGEVRAEDHERRLGEVHHAGRPVDDHETDRQQRVRAPDPEPADDPGGDQFCHVWTSVRSPPAYSSRFAYMSSIRSANRTCSVVRLTFWVAVSSPSSWSSSFGIVRNLRTFSTRANLALTCLITPCMSVRTSSFSERSRYVVYGMRRRCAQLPTVSSSIPINAVRYGRRSPMTIASLMNGDVLSAFSISDGATFLPPAVMITSLIRSMILIWVPSTHSPTSPLCSQPSLSRTSAVSSGRFQ